MKAGRELDALVAEKVMGWRNISCLQGGNIAYGEPDDDWNRDVDEHKKHGTCGFQPDRHREEIPGYSEDISAAWEVVEKIEKDGADFIVNGGNHYGGWVEKYHAGFTWDHEKYIDAFANTVPLAICLAALKSVGVEVKEGE